LKTEFSLVLVTQHRSFAPMQAQYTCRKFSRRDCVLRISYGELSHADLSLPCDLGVPTSCGQKKGADFCRAQTTKGEWRVFVIQILLINKSKFDEFSMSFVRHHVKET